MRDSIVFFRQADRGLDFRLDTGVYKDLGTWLVSDTQNYAPDCLEILATLEDVRAGRLAEEDIDGNAYSVHVTRSEVRAEHLFMDSSTVYTHDEAHAAVLDYWHFLTEPEHRPEQVKAWETEFGRPHPCGAHLGA